MATVHEPDRSPKHAETQTRTYSVQVKTKEGMRKIKVIVKPRPAHEFRQLPDTNKEHFRAFMKGVGSIVSLMPGPPPMIQRSQVGSWSETSKRVAQIWDRSLGRQRSTHISHLHERESDDQKRYLAVPSKSRRR